MNILSIETSCDETSLALVTAEGGLENPRFEIHEHLVASQVETHAPYGGVVPMLAKREHIKNLPILYGKIFGTSHIANGTSQKDIDFIAVTVGPGLEPALWQGIEFARKLGKAHDIPVIGTNHLHGHLYSFLLEQEAGNSKSEYRNAKQIRNPKLETNNQLPKTNYATELFPAVQLLVSGGHTMLVLMRSLTDWELLGQTQDDAAGEAFDKVGRMLDLPFPGGPHIEKLAQGGNPTAISFPRPMLHSGDYNFSFSGLKTAVLYFLRENKVQNNIRDDQRTNQRLSALASDVAASFQEAAVDVLAQKTIRGAMEHSAKTILLSGGVAASQYLRARIEHDSKEIGAQFMSAPAKYQTDNAAMIAVAGYVTCLQDKGYPLDAEGRLPLT